MMKVEMLIDVVRGSVNAEPQGMRRMAWNRAVKAVAGHLVDAGEMTQADAQKLVDEVIKANNDDHNRY